MKKAFKKLLASCLIVVMLLTAAPLSNFVSLGLSSSVETKAEATAYSGTCGDNLFWLFDADTGVLTISGAGEMYNSDHVSNYHYNYITMPWYSYSDYIKSVIIKSGVTSIGDFSFSSCGNLTNISIANTITSIGSSAFQYCPSLISITIPDSVISIGDRAFYNCTSLTSAIISDSVTSIGEEAFYDCTNLTSVTIPDSVTSIGTDAFYNTRYYVDESYWTDGVLYINNHLIEAKSSVHTNYIIKSGTKTIADGAFYDCTGLTNITIPDSVTSIGEEAFYDCTSLTSITIPDSVTSIGDSAFYYCSKLTSVTIGKSVTSIGDYAFANATKSKNLYYTGDMAGWLDISFGNLYSSPIHSYNSGAANNIYMDGDLLQGELVVPDGTTSIGTSAFAGFSYITSIKIPYSVTNIGDFAFYNCYSITSVTIPDSVTSIGADAFYNTRYHVLESYWTGSVLYINNHLIYGNDAITGSYTIKSGTKTIAGSAFYNCKDLTNITIPDSVITIGDSAFAYCDSLTDVSSGNNLITIGDSAFYNCFNLTSLTIPDTVTSIGGSAFYNCTGITDVTIPDGVVIIGDKAFYNCTNITSSITIPGSVTSIGGSAFYNCTGITDVTILDNVTSIGSSAFYNCTGITDVIIPASVTSIGWGAFRYCTALKSITIPDGVKILGDYVFDSCGSLMDIIIPDSVTTIGECALADCASLTSLTIPDSVITIVDWAFYNCTGLKELVMPASTKIPNSEKVFYHCNNIEKLTLTKGTGIMQNYEKNKSSNPFATYYKYTPWYVSGCKDIVIADGVTSIGDNAFYDCNKLTNITIPDSVTTIIGLYTFYGCDNLENVYYTGDVAGWCGITFDNCYSNPMSCAANLYFNGQLAKDIVIPDGITSIGNYVFYGCTGLKSVIVPDSVITIGVYAFYGCNALEEITLPFVGASANATDEESVFGYIFGHTSSNATGTTLQYHYVSPSPPYNSSCYYYIPSTLRKITISKDETIPYRAFYNCKFITEINIPGAISLGESAFHNCTSLTSITIPDSVIFIGDKAFYNCTSLTSATISDSVTSIGDSVFYGCTGLTNVTIPDSVTSIGNSAFSGCAGLTSVTIPDSVTSIDSYAFAGCTNLISVRIPGSVTNISNNQFKNCTGLYSVTLCTGVQSVGSSVFSGCKNINSFTISSTVTGFHPGNSNPTYIYYGGSKEEWEKAKFSLPKNENRVIYYNSDIPPSSDRISFSRDVYSCFIGENFYISGDLVSTKAVGDVTLTWTSEDGVELYTPASVINSSQYKASFSVEAKGVELGYYTVSVKGSNGKSDSCMVRVAEPKSELYVSVTDLAKDGYYCIDNKLVDNNLNELDSVSYKITVENKLSIESAGIPLTDKIKEQLTIENISIDAALSDYSSLAIDIADITELKNIGNLAPGEKKVYTLNIYPLKLENKEISAEINMIVTASDEADISINTPVIIKNKLYTPQAIVSFYVYSEVIYNEGNYSANSLPVTLRITNRIPSDFKGAVSKIKDLPEYQIKLTDASVIVLESDLIKKTDINHTVTNNTLKPGDSLTLSGTITINTKHKISELIEAEYVGIEYEVNTSANRSKGNKIVTFVNKDFKESSDELSKKAQEELKKLKKKHHAETAFDPFIRNYLNDKELAELSDLLLTQIILQTLPEESLVNKVKDKLKNDVSGDVLDAIESVDKEVAKYVNTLKNIQEITPSVTKETIKSKITIQTSEGPVTIYFDGTLDKYDYNDRNFANITNSLNYRLEGDHIPKGAAGTSGTVNATLVKVDEFSKAAEDVAVDAIIDACTEAYGTDIDKAKDVLFGRTAEKIANKAAKIAWVVATSPSKVVSADCPVDIFVYDENGNLCASVESDVITRSCEKASFEISASKKSVRLFDENYTVKFVPTGNATMNVTVEEYANSFSVLRTIEFTDVPISYGDTYLQSVNTEFMNKNNSYSLTLEDGTVVEPDTVIENFHYHIVEKYETVAEANCLTAEVVCGECTVCKDLVYDTIGELAECSVGEWIITVQPTQTSEGKKVQLCTVCGEILKQENIDKLPQGKAPSVSINNFTMKYKDSTTITPNIEVDVGVDYTVSYASSNPSVASVDENGNVSTNKTGSATITVTVTDEYGNTVTDTCEVKVNYSWWQWILVILLFGWIWY